MKNPCISFFSLYPVVEDKSALRDYVADHTTPGNRTADLDEAQLVHQALFAKVEQAGFTLLDGTSVRSLTQHLGQMQVDVAAQVDRPDLLWQAAQDAFQRAHERPLDRALTTEEQIFEVLIHGTGRPRPYRFGMKVWPVESNDAQEDVRFAWVYPDEDGDSLPAHVDLQSGFVSVLGEVPQDVAQSSVRKRIETDDDLYDCCAGEQGQWVLKSLQAFQAERGAKSSVTESAPSVVG